MKKFIQKFTVLHISVAIAMLLVGLAIGVLLNPGQTIQQDFSVASTPRPQPETNYYSVSEGVVFKGSEPVKLKGANWFGFEVQDHVVHGLWQRNWKDMIRQMKEVGINSVRVPFCPASIRPNTNPNSIDYSKNPDLQGLTSLEILDKVMAELNNQQMHILLDMHRIDDACSYISDLWYLEGEYPESRWINDLKFVAERYQGLDYFMGIDLKNEPHGSATWGTGNSATDWNKAAERAGEAVLGVNPNLLIFVEGVQENPVCSDSSYGHWWGGNLEPFACAPISTDAIPKNKLVLSPHVYGPDVYEQPYFNTDDFNQKMPPIWDKHFGYLVDEGYTIIIGEWGGRYGNGGISSDKDWQDALVSYMLDKQICNSFYWSWNPNSGDTGGILKDDWTNVWDNKVQMLNNYWKRCKLPDVTVSPVEIPGPITPPLPEPEPEPEPGDGGDGGDEGTPVCTAEIKVCPDGSTVKRNPKLECKFNPCPSDGSDGGIVEPIDPIDPKPIDPIDPDPEPNAMLCDVNYKIVNQWNNGFVAEVEVKNLSGKDIKNWKLEYMFLGNQRIKQMWNGRYNQPDETVVVRPESYNKTIKNNGSASFGFSASYSGVNKKLSASDFTLNGMQCGVKNNDNGGGTTTPTEPEPIVKPAVKYCKVNYKVSSQWGNGFVADVSVKNISGQDIENWELTWKFPGKQKVVNSWNTKLTQNDKQVTATNQSYNAKISNNGKVNFGFQASYEGQNGPINSPQFSLNGNRCQ